MNCPLCNECVESTKAPGRCIYGGPYVGFIDVSKRPGKFWYMKLAIRTFTEAYGVKSGILGPKTQVKRPELAS